MSDTIAQDVYSILSNYARPKDATIDSATELKKIKIDSFNIVEILFDLEEHFDIVIPNIEGTATLRTAGDVVTEVKNILAENGR